MTVFLSILNQMRLPFGSENRKENCHHDHIPFNLKRIGYIVFSVQVAVIIGNFHLNLSIRRINCQQCLRMARSVECIPHVMYTMNAFCVHVISYLEPLCFFPQQYVETIILNHLEKMGLLGSLWPTVPNAYHARLLCARNHLFGIRNNTW